MSTIINSEVQNFQSQQIKETQGPNENNDQLFEVNPIILLKQPQIFKETFSKIIKIAFLSFKNKDLQKGLILYNTALDMLDLGKNILKQHISKYTKLTIFVNLAYGNQNLRKLQKASRFCERAKQQLDRLISLAKNQEYSIGKYLKLTKFLVTLKFQHCAIVSQLQQHQKALQMCKSTLPQLKEEIQTMLKYLRQTSGSKLIQKKTGQTVQFSKHVERFAQNLLVQLINFLNQPLKRFHFYHWQKNPELNQEQVKKKFIPSCVEAKNECKRSILGVSKSNCWMDEFNIGSIMHMSMVSVQDFEMVLPMKEYFFKDKLYELVILCSLSYFTMATEIRFLEPFKEKQAEIKIFQRNQNKGQQITEDKSNENHSQSQETMQNKNKTHFRSQKAEVILKKYGYEQRSQMHKLSELYHLRSIEIICRHIQAVIPYLMHIIKSYDKHYLKKRELQPIAAINQQSQMSMINQSLQQYIPEEQIYNDYMKKDSIENNEPMGQLLLQSHDGRSVVLTKKKSSPNKNPDQEFIDVKNILDFGPSSQHSLNEPLTQIILQENKNKFRKNLSKIIQDPKLQSENNFYSRAQNQVSTPQENEFPNGQYLKSKKNTEIIRSGKKTKNPSTKMTKSKSKQSKLNLIKSRDKSKSSTFKKNQKSSQTNIYTYRSPKEEKRSTSKSQYQTHKIVSSHNQNQLNLKKYHSPQLQTINQSKKRLKTNLSQKSRQKLLKKFVGVPNNHCEEKNKFEPKQNKKTKNSDKKSKCQEQSKKKQSKYFTTFDGEKQYRIKHQSTTHIKVLYKKKSPTESKAGLDI